MRAFTQRPRASHGAESDERTPTVNSHFGHGKPSSEQEPTAISSDGLSARFGHDFGRLPLRAGAVPPLQAKPTVSTPGDRFEREAESVAERVSRMPEPSLMRACACGGDCPKCSQGNGEHQKLQARPADPAAAATAAAPPSVGEVTRSSGETLDPSTRRFMEPRFGYDFSRVRVHTDARAQQSARDVRARAYTVGRDIVFAAGQYAPHTEAGRRLLAHELTHVAQQSAGQPTALVQREGEEEQPGEGDGDGPNPPPIPEAPPPVSATPTSEEAAPEEAAPELTGPGPFFGHTTEITLETGNTAASPLNNLVHQQVCVDGYSAVGRKRCFSFGADGVQAPQFSTTWLGWSSIVAGALLHGLIYESVPVSSASIANRHVPTMAQAANWLDYMTGTRLGLTDGYSVARHNCRAFSQWEFRDAPLHW